MIVALVFHLFTLFRKNPDAEVQVVNMLVEFMACQVHQFLGMFNSYHCYIPKVTGVIVSLDEVLKGLSAKDKVSPLWPPEIETAF